MPLTVDFDEAEARFEDLVSRVEGGEEVIITRGGRAIACLIPFDEAEAWPRASHSAVEPTPEPLEAVWRLAALGRENVAGEATSGHDNLYDELGLPR